MAEGVTTPGIEAQIESLQLCSDKDGKEKSPLEHMPNLVWERILGYLDGRQLLTLRRVSKTINGHIFADSRQRSWDEFCLRFVHTENDNEKLFFEVAAQSGFKVSRLFLLDFGVDIYKSPGLSIFAGINGAYIRKLKLATFFAFHSNEYRFFESLVNLEELSIGMLDASRRPSPLNGGVQPSPRHFPTNLSRLKKLKLRYMFEPEYTVQYFNTIYHWELIAQCTSLEYLGLAYIGDFVDVDYEDSGYNIEADLPPPNETAHRDYLRNHIKPIFKNLTTLAFPKTKVPFPTGAGCMEFKFIMEECLLDLLNDRENPLQLRNVAITHVICNVWKYPGHLLSDRLSRIRSMIEFPPDETRLLLPNLEKLHMNSVSRAITWTSLQVPPDWPLLKSVFVPIDEITPRVKKVLKFLFHDMNRPSVTKLGIFFHKKFANLQNTGLINAKLLATNFKNLQTLSIERWNLKSVLFLNLWEGLGNLVELKISNCTTFGDLALIGKDPKLPVFLKLKNLRILTLRAHKVKMPFLTDVAFQTVFSKINLKEFYLDFDEPLENVTNRGIESLLKGEFGKSIEKFPFRNWSMASMSPEEFTKLGKQFRSIL